MPKIITMAFRLIATDKLVDRHELTSFELLDLPLASTFVKSLHKHASS